MPYLAHSQNKKKIREKKISFWFYSQLFYFYLVAAATLNFGPNVWRTSYPGAFFYGFLAICRRKYPGRSYQNTIPAIVIKAVNTKIQ